MQQLIGFFDFFMSEPSKSQRRSGQKGTFPGQGNESKSAFNARRCGTLAD